MKLTASGLLLAVMFVLVFAGTLSGAFGIENCKSDTVDFEYGLSDILGNDNHVAEAVTYETANKRAVMSASDVNKEVAITGLYGNNSTNYWTSTGDATHTYNDSYGYGWNPSFSTPYKFGWTSYPSIDKSSSSTTKVNFSSINSAINPGTIISIKITATVYAFTTLSSNSGGTSHYTEVDIESSFTESSGYESVANVKAENTGNNDKEESSTGTKEYSSGIGDTLYLKLSATYHKDGNLLTGANGSTHRAFVKDIKITVTVPRYTITYNANKPYGATTNPTGTTADSFHDTGVAKQLTANGYALAGYEFLGWTLTPYTTPQDALPSGGFSDKQSVINLSTTDGAIVTLYAVWGPLFGLIYHENGDSKGGNENITTVTVRQGTSITLLTASNLPGDFTKSGYYFAGWADTADSQVSIGSSITAGDNGTQRHIYAIWKPITYTITFNINNTNSTAKCWDIPTITLSGQGGTNSNSLPYRYSMQDGFLANWAWNTTGSGDNFKPNTQIPAAKINAVLTSKQANIGTSNVVLEMYAQWVEDLEFGNDSEHVGEQWGSQSNPYIIRKIEQLKNLALIVNGNCSASASGVKGSIVGSSYAYATSPLASENGGYANCYFKLEVDITDMSGFTTPIGTNTSAFSGFFEGNNKTLSGININVAGNYVGLFGYTSGATIQNLTVNGSVKGSKYVGGVVGYALNTTIDNVTNNATVTARYSTDNDVGGSIIQYDGGNNTNEGFDKVFDNNTSTKFCGNKNTGMSFVADLGSKKAVSGFAITNANDTASNTSRRPKTIQIWGSNTKTSRSNYNDKDSGGNTPSGAGESGWTLVYSVTTDSFPTTNYQRNEFAFTGNKTYTYQYYWVYIISAGAIIQFSEFDFLAPGEDAGGVVGYASGTSGNGAIISNVRNNASITGSSYTGGLVGRASGIFAITDSSNAGGIMGFNGVAGVLGAMTDNANVTITSCQNSGTVSSSPGSNGVAGIIGRLDAASNRLVVQGCKNTAAITGDRNVGGIGGRIETTRNTKDSLVFANCYNSGSIAATTCGTVGGIAGYFFANGTSIADVATISYCFSSGTVSSNNTASDKNIGGIVGNPRASTLTSTRVYNCYTMNTTYAISGTANATIDNTNYVIASGASAPSTTNGGKYLVYNSAFTFKPAIISGSTYTSYNSWTVIAEYVNTTVNGEAVRVFNDINGFMVSGNVAPSSNQYFLSRKGVSSSEYLTPSKVENSNPTNAENRSNTATFTVTAWYVANTQSDIYCSTESVAIANGTETYNGKEQGFARTDVNPPLANGKVYGVVFDYYNANVTPIETFVCTFDANGNKISGSTNPSQAGDYNTTVFIKIGEVIVGKKGGETYKITQETINVSWAWTDGKQSNLFDRTGTNDQFVYNRAEQGLSRVTFAYAKNTFTDTAESRFTLTGNGTFTTENGKLKETNASSSAYSRTYTLNDTRNFKIHSTNTNADLSGTTINFKWTIRKNKLHITNLWTSIDVGSETNAYVFEYNAAHQGIVKNDGITVASEVDTTGTAHLFDAQNLPYTINPYADTINIGTYTRTLTLTDTTNYIVVENQLYSREVRTNTRPTKGVSSTDTSVTYTWKINAYNIADNFANGKVWFGGIADDNGLIVGNQLTSVISGTLRNNTTVNVDYYPLQEGENGEASGQKVLVYGQTRYAKDKFVIYVQYNDGRIAQLSNATATEYTLSDLEAPTTTNPTPINTNVTATGTGNFAGNISKYYTVLYSDFGWKSDKNPDSANWGSADNPYVIDSPEYLLRLSQIVNGGMAWNSIDNATFCYAPQLSNATAQNRTYSGTYFLVSANIDMSAYVSTDGLTNFLPVGGVYGSTEYPFSATFDGKGTTSDGKNYEIKYIYNIGHFVNNESNQGSNERFDYVGLFGYTDGATIQNLIVKSDGGYSVSANSVTYSGGIHGRDYVGGIVGKAVNSTLDKIKLDYGGKVYGNDYVGGIVGFAQNTTVANSGKILNASVQGRFYVGGIAGEWQVYDKSQLGLGNQQSLSPIDSSTVSGVKYVGGLVGWLDLSNCSGSVSFTPQYNNGASITLEVKGTEYVGTLFGTLVGNGYHQTATSANSTYISIEQNKVGNVTLKPVTYSDGNSTYLPKVVGGLVGYIESAALIFGTSWNTSNITFDFNKTSTSFLGGVVGVMGKNSTIEMLTLNKDDGTQLTVFDGTITGDTEFGKQGTYNAGSFVGGIVGYVSSQAGTFWSEGTTIFGNAAKLVNAANIYATGFAGGIFGALGNIALDKMDGSVYAEISVASDSGTNRASIIQNILVDGVRDGLSGSMLGIAPTTDSAYVVGADGKLRNTANVHVSKSNGVGGDYVGGILGYCGASVRLVLRNKTQANDMNDDAISALNVYSGGVNKSIGGNYAGGIAGFCDNLEHELQYIVVQVRFTNENATRVGGLVGEMTSGKIEGCVVVSPLAEGEDIAYDTDTFKGAEYVGGLVGKTENVSIKNSIATGFKLENTSITKGGVLGGGTNPTIEASWTFYIANEGATYSTVSKNTYGKYILVDKAAITSNGSSYPSFEKLCAFAGIANTATDGAVGILEFALNVPTQRQLAFYDASGSDKETTNKDSFVGFKNVNNVLTIKLDMETGTSMQVCIVDIRFVNVPKCEASSTEDQKKNIVSATYRKPSNSDRYHVNVTTAEFDTSSSAPTYQVTHIIADVYFDYNGDLVYIGTAESSEKTGSYDSGTLTPGSETNPYTISKKQEWEEFAASVNNGTFRAGSYVRLLNDISIDTLAGTSTNRFTGTFDGNGHTINLGTRGDDADGTSLFPYAKDAIFRNLTVSGTISNTSKEGLAGFVGIANGKLEFYNCTNNVNVTAYRNAAGFSGFVSTYDIVLIGCVNNGNIETKEQADNSSDSYAPVYYTYGTGGIIACIAISGTSARTFTIKSCINNGNITASVNVGGIVGKISGNHSGDTISARCDLYVYDCANTGEISSTQSLSNDQAGAFWDGNNKYYGRSVWCNAGGLVGIVFKSAALHLYSSYNSGYVHGIGNVVGGLVGSIGDHNGGTYRTPNSRAAYPSEIYYCFNTGKVQVGYDGVNTSNGINIWGTSGDKYCSAVVGGIVGVMSYGTIAYCYNTGNIDSWGGVGVEAAYHARVGGIIGESTANAQADNWTKSVVVRNCYNVGQINIYTKEKVRYASGIVGYMDANNALNNTKVQNCYTVTNTVYWRQDGKYYNELLNGGDEEWTISGTLSDLSGLTAKMNSNGALTTTFAEGTGNAASIDSLTNDSAYQAGTAEGYIYIYGCLPQLAVFAVDTHDALSMRSVGFGMDQYGEYDATAVNSGTETYPFIIRDGIGLLGMQALVDLGYDFDDQYIEFANSSNNIKADGSNQSNNPLICASINLPYTSEQTTYLSATAGYYMSSSNGSTFNQAGKSYHLFALGAVCRSTPGITGSNANNTFNYWIGNNYYYNGAYGNRDGDYVNYCTFKVQNMPIIGRNGKSFKGSISGKQDGGANTVINNLRVTIGKATGGAYAGLFGHIEDAYVGYIEVGGESNIWAYSSDGSQIAATGAIAGYATGSTIIEHCAVSGTAAIGAYGKTDIVNIATDNITFAGGIVGLADTKQGNSYNAGTTLTIKDCSVNITATTDDRSAFAGKIVATKNNIGGVLGYVDGASGASGKGNSVRIENCNVQKAIIQAASSATTSSHIGGVLGFGSQYVSAFVTGCKVGVDGNVTISGEHSLGGIAGGMSNAQGGYIDSCTVGSGTSITRIDQGGDNQVAESANHGTAIGGLVGFTQNSTDTVSPLTTTFSGTSSFAGTITVGVAASNQSADSDAAISCIGGIVGDMGSGANFASGSVVTVGGTISVTLAAANVGGVAGRTNTATFIGNFNVQPTMTTALAENVGGFIGKNIGTVYILADNTDKLANGNLKGTQISIGGTIVGTNEVGGFIGVNNSESTLNIGSNVANAKPYRSGTLNITITATVTGSGENVGGIVGKNEGATASNATDYATIDIVKGVILQQGNIQGQNYVGGIIGRNQGLLTTGGGEADTSVGGATLTEDQINSIKNLSITNEGNVKGGATAEDGTYANGDYVGGVIGFLDSPDTLKTTDDGKGAIAGTFTNKGTVEGSGFVGGSIGFVGKNVTITAKDTDTLFVNSGSVTAHGYFAGGSIGALVGTIEGVSTDYMVNFENEGNVNATGFVGGSIGVLAGPVKFAQFVNKSGGLTVSAVNAVGGSVGYIGIPTPFETEIAKLNITLDDDYIKIVNTHFEAAGNLSTNATLDVITAAKNAASDKSTGWGGVGGAIGVIGEEVAKWGANESERNTYYANGNVVASGINNVGGIVGLVNANNITISNMLAHKTTVTGGENVGGIVGATKGTGTVIKSAYAVEGTFDGISNIGGIIGLAASDTDAKTSYWVKGYSNAILAGTDVSKLQEELGKFETIVETVDGQEVVFTEEFCKLYTPKTYYDDYTGTHKYGNTTITAVTDENLTWAQYFTSNLNITGATINNGAWVKPTGATTYTTGTENTGWYFVYANDKIANPSNTTIGTISAEHSPNANLSYWKRIADAYTASERENHDDTKTLDASAIVSGDNGQPQKSTLYATATSAGENSGYYLYMATSGNSRPSATFDNSKFYIKTLTVNENTAADGDTTGDTEEKLAGNVAVYYRTISRGKSLTYNGNTRYAPVAITASGDTAVPFIATPSTDATKADSYCYSSDTSTVGTNTVPGTFESNVKIYYFDSVGTPHVVGGVAIDWEIKKRDLEAEFSKGTQRTYGEDRKETGNDADKHDVTLTVSNIAPNQGANPALTITVTDKNGNSTVFTFNGMSMSPTSSNGITIVGAGITNMCENKWDASDSLYNVTEPSEKQTYEFSCAIDFQNAAEYTITASLSTTSAALYNIGTSTTTFSVKPKELKITGSGTDSVMFDNKTHPYAWKVSGLVTKAGYEDTLSVLAAFSPKACAKIKDDATSYEVELYSSQTALKTGNIALGTLEGVSLNISINSNSIDLEGANKAGEYYLTFATLTAGNYTLKLEGGTTSANQSKKLAISTNELSFTWQGGGGKHTYDKKTTGVIILTIKAKKSIDDFANFVNKYFTMSMSGTSGYKAPEMSVSTDNMTATVTFTTGVNAGKYTATAALNTKESAFIEAHKGSCAYPTLPQSKSYEILRRSLSFEFSTSNGTYNAANQGWNGVRAKSATSGSDGIISGDSVKVGIAITRNGSSFKEATNVSVSTSYEKGGLSTTAAGNYVATVTFDANNSANSNYTASAVTASWEISKKTLTLKGLTSGTRIYDGTAITPTLSINGESTTNGQFKWGDDVISVTYSVVDAQNNSHESLVNAGTYTITIGGTNAISVLPAMRDGISTTENYSVDTTDSGSATYKIEPRQIKLSWDATTAFVFNNAAQGLTITGVEGVDGSGQLAVSSSTITEARIKGYAGNDVIIITISGAKKDVANSKKSSMTATRSSVTGKNADNSTNSISGNYEIYEGSSSGEFEITPSVVSIRFNATNATLEKVYDGNNIVPTSKILDSYFTVSATGHVPTSNPFTISGRYDNENVVYDSSYNVIGGKAVTFSYTFTDPSGNGNYISEGGTVDDAVYNGAGTAGATAYNVGKITPAHIKVTLDKLRSNKATRTYTDGTTYGGNGASGNGRSSTYRAGEGFNVSGILSGDSVTITANYAESIDSRNSSANNSFDFSKYVNDVYKDADGTFKKAVSGTYLKKLVFEMTGSSASNYTFNVYHSSDGTYSNSDGNYATKVTVYDSREKDQNRKNASGSPSIQIEITVKSVKVEYSNTAQSYANDDNSYNTDWQPITGTNKETDKAGADIIVTNGWMYSDGVDHSSESDYSKREYHGYTTIQGRSGNSRLGASVSTKDGMNLNYRLSNQPILTIAYFVTEGDEYKVGSLAQLLIASFYYTAHQNSQNPDIINIVSSGYEWVTVVKVDESGTYVGEYAKPANSPIENSTATDWDEYLVELQAADYAVFLDTEKGEWGYYQSTQSTTTAIPTKFVQTKDITGTFTAEDIELLNAFFTTSSVGEDGTVTSKSYNWNGTNKQFLTNVLKARAGANVTIDGSLFVSTATVEGSNALTGFDGTYDGNGYVIEYLNIMGYGKTNVGLFDIIGAGGIVKNVHLRNITINANQGNVGSIAGSVLAAAEAASETSIKNVSAHGAINVSDGTVGGLFGTSARNIENAIVLGTITSQNATVGGVVGTMSASINNVVSLVQITANGGTVNPFTTSSATIDNSYHMTNAVWKQESGFVNVSGKSKTFNELMTGSVSGYGTQSKYYYTGDTAPTKGMFDVLADVQLTALSAIGAQNAANERQSMRLKDIVLVYLMMYSLSKTTGTLTGENNTKFNVNIYELSSSSWLVGTADGTQSNPIAIANKQNVSLLRQFPFATFTLKTNVSIDIASTFAGAFFGTVESAKNTDGTSLGYKITCNKAMFEAYAESSSSWLTT